MFRWSRDEEYAGVTPGLIPPPGTGTVRRVSGGKEWKGTVAVQFHPPVGVRPALAGTVIDGSVDPRDLGAMLIDLSLRGYFSIAGEGGSQDAGQVGGPGAARVPARAAGGRGDGAVTRNADWSFTQARELPKGDQLSRVEADMLTAIFATGPRVSLSTLKPRLAGALRIAAEDIYAEVMQRGWYRRHPQPRGLERLLGRSPRTADGTAVRIQTMGFRKYLATAEADQIKFEEAAGLFSRYLPYAMIFGLADRWAGVISEVFRAARIDDISQIASNMAFDPFMWMFADDLINLGGSALIGLTDVLTDSNGLLDLGDMAGMVGDVFGSVTDAIGDFDFGDLFDF